MQQPDNNKTAGNKAKSPEYDKKIATSPGLPTLPQQVKETNKNG